jgi:hypothetical protein
MQTSPSSDGEVRRDMLQQWAEYLDQLRKVLLMNEMLS